MLWQTVVFAAACVVATLAVGAGLAVLLTRIGRVPRRLLSLAALAAWAAPAMTGSTVWMFLFDTNLGLVNQVLGLHRATTGSTTGTQPSRWSGRRWCGTRSRS